MAIQQNRHFLRFSIWLLSTALHKFFPSYLEVQDGMKFGTHLRKGVLSYPLDV